MKTHHLTHKGSDHINILCHLEVHVTVLSCINAASQFSC